MYDLKYGFRRAFVVYKARTEIMLFIATHTAVIQLDASEGALYAFLIQTTLVVLDIMLFLSNI